VRSYTISSASTTGAAITLVTGRGLLYLGVGQVIFGLSAAAITFDIGKLLGVSLGG
jgi:vacuolar iron transporter family protein